MARVDCVVIKDIGGFPPKKEGPNITLEELFKRFAHPLTDPDSVIAQACSQYRYWDPQAVRVAQENLDAFTDGCQAHGRMVCVYTPSRG